MAKLLMTAKLYAIRHVPSGLYLPQRQSPGYTRMPVEAWSTTPRLFWSRRGAAIAAGAWLKGVWTRPSVERDWTGAPVDIVPSEPPAVPPVDRRPDDLELVEFNLSELPANSLDGAVDSRGAR